MARTKQTKKAQSDVVPTPTTPSVVSGEQDWKPGQSDESYVVVRDGLRVSDQEYPTINWPEAVAERNFWKHVANRYLDGTKVEIVKYDKKKHRVW